jgi:hypothetical protein
MKSAFFGRIALSFLLFLAFAESPARADSCLARILRGEFFSSRSEPILTSTEQQLWRKELNRADLIPPVSILNRNENIFFSLYERLPASIQEKLESDEAIKPKSLQTLQEQLGITSETLLSTLANYGERLSSPGPSQASKLKAWLKQGRKNYEALPQSERNAFSAQLSLLQSNQAAQKRWQTELYALPRYELGAHGSVKVSIGNHSYSGVIKRHGQNPGHDDRVILTVPAKMIRRPVSNPSEPEKFKSLQKNRIGPPDVYRSVDLGLDGIFYLNDGGHRFMMYDAQSKAVKVEIGFPPRTASLSHFLDYIGVDQPESAKILDIFSRKTPALSVLPQTKKETLLWSNPDLLMAP